MRSLNLLATMAVFAAAPLAAQHEHQDSPYASMEFVEGTTLTPAEVEQLRAGAGMSLALPGELNHYPGPKHVLEMAHGLELTPEQTEKVTAIREVMSAKAITAGELVIAANRALAAAFGDGGATVAMIDQLTHKAGVVAGQLQAIHLAAHVQTQAILTPDQIKKYDELRGYTQAGSTN